MSKQINIPQLRFPEFKGEWKIETLNNVFSKKSTKNKGSKIKTVLTNSATQGIILQNEYFDKDIANQNNLEGYYIVEVDDFVYNPRISVSAPVGPLKRNNLCLGVMSPLYTVLRNLKGELGFFEYYFESGYWYRYMRGIANYGARHDRMNITSEGFQNLPVPFPSLAEQKKIADFLIEIDKRIAQLTAKKEHLEQYKKGVMQQLFSSALGLERLEDDRMNDEVKNNPTILKSQKSQFRQLRFKDKDGNEFPEWEKKKLGEVGTFFSGGTPLTTKREYFDGTIPFIRSGEINSNKTEQFITELGLKKSSAKKVEVGDILYALFGATSGEVGISKINGAINQAVLCIRSSQNHYFIYSFLKLEKENIIKTYLQGGQGNLSADIVKKIEIPLPSLPEQTAIANFLSTIDEKIINCQLSINHYEKWKKGLLQKMFV